MRLISVRYSIVHWEENICQFQHLPIKFKSKQISRLKLIIHVLFCFCAHGKQDHGLKISHFSTWGVYVIACLVQGAKYAPVDRFMLMPSHKLWELYLVYACWHCVCSTWTKFNPFTVPACTISYIFDPITHLLSMQCVLMKILLHVSAKRRQKGLRLSNFALL